MDESEIWNENTGGTCVLSDNDCHKYILDFTILVFNLQFVNVKYVTNTLVYVSLEDASSYAKA